MTSPRYRLSADAAEWIAGQFGADDPTTPAPGEVAGLISAAAGDQIITGGPDGTDLTANCEPDGWKIMIGPRHLDFWITSGMQRATNSDGIEIPVTYLELLTRAADVANGLLDAWENAVSPGAGPPPSWAGDWNSPEDAAYDTPPERSVPAGDPNMAGMARDQVRSSRESLGLDHAGFAAVLAPLLGYTPTAGQVRSWETKVVPPGDVVLAAGIAAQAAEGRGPCICEGRGGHTDPACPWYEGPGR